MNSPHSNPTGGAAKQPGGEAAQNPLLLVHRLLRGRYVLVAVLVAVLGPVGAAIGYKALPPEYKSQATIRIAPVMPKILYENEENSMIPMFDAFVQTQMSLITSSRVRDLAMQSPTWRDVGGRYSSAEADAFGEGLAVERPKGSQIVIVSYTDGEPKRAQAGVKAVVDAYMKIYGEQNTATDAQRFQVLEERARGLNSEIDGYQAEILKIANEYGSDDLAAVYAYRIQELQKIETELEAAKLQLANLSAAEPVVPEASVELPVERIAAMDTRMQQLVSERDQILLQIEEIKAIRTNPEERPEYQRAQRQLELKNQQIEQYAQIFRESYDPGPMSPVGSIGGMAALSGMALGALPVITDPEQARERVERIQALYEEARAATLDLGRKNLTLQDLRTKLAQARERLDQTRSRMEQLSVEGQFGGRISKLSEAELPSSPSNAHKFKQFAVMGGLAGSGLGVGLVLLLGLLNPRIRFIADAENQYPRLLGALPNLPEKLSDPVEAMVAAQCVHQIRMMLQPRARLERARTLTVTSAAAGTGKTSLTLALALSFAAAGARTLVIDGDIVGMGLTRRTRDLLRRKPSRFFRKGDGEAVPSVVTDPSPGKSLICLTGPDETVSGEANGNGKEPRLGLLDALEGQSVDRCIAYTGVPNLRILPACGAQENPLAVMSRSAMTALVDGLRDSYDIILIDSGPVPGPTDSSIMAASADGVIMVASRGEHTSVVRQAIQHLDLIQAPLMGLVFNRAHNRDLERTGHSSATSSKCSGYPSSVRALGQADLDSPSAALARFGPLAQAVWATSGAAPIPAEAAPNPSS